MLTSNGSVSDHVLFVERANELWYAARLRSWSFGAEGKPSVKSANESVFMGPKPGDLPMSRMKVP